MTQRFVIIVNSDPQSQGGHCALKFATALLDAGQTLTQVFFYQAGIYASNTLNCPASDELNLLTQWQQLHQTHRVDLITCVAASLRRGVIDKELASQQQLATHNLADGFRLGGLGEFVIASANADKLIQF